MKEVRKVVALLLVLVMVSSVVSPVMAANPEKSACGCNAKPNKNVDTTELKGSEKDKVIEKALKNDEVRKLAKQLREEGYTQESVKAYKALIKAEDGSTSEVLVVGMMFQSDEGETKSITYANNPTTDDSVVILGLWSCAECAAIIIIEGIGCSAVCIVGGSLTFGTACIVCIVAAAVPPLCPCYDCCCATTGNSDCCNSYDNLCD